MFELTVIDTANGAWNVTGTRIFATREDLHRELQAYGVAPRYFSAGAYGYGGLRCEWREIPATPATAEASVPTRAHRYCAGSGTITLASGAPATCMGCSGTGRIPAPTAAQRASQDITARRHTNALRSIKAYAQSVADTVDNVEYLATSGMDHLHTREPHRMERLYASVESGRTADVVRALYAYRVAIG